MRNRDTLYRLVDELPDSEIGRAQRVLAALQETEGPLYTLDTAPENDEAETPDESSAVEEARGSGSRRARFLTPRRCAAWGSGEPVNRLDAAGAQRGAEAQ